MSLDQLFELTGGDKQAFLDAFAARRLTLRRHRGSPRPAFRHRQAVPHRGAPSTSSPPTGRRRQRARALDAGEPGRSRSIGHAHYQLYSIPEMCGAAVDVLHLEKENGYHVDVEALDALLHAGDEVICINNPDNPTGALLDGGRCGPSWRWRARTTRGCTATRCTAT